MNTIFLLLGAAILPQDPPPPPPPVVRDDPFFYRVYRGVGEVFCPRFDLKIDFPPDKVSDK